MKSLAVSYTEELLREQKYLANWLPNNPIKLGDIGIFQDNCFVKQANLADYNIAFEKEEGIPRADINYSSSGGVSVSSKLSGSLLPGSVLQTADAGIVVEFSKERAICIKTKSTRSDTIKNKIALEPQLLQLYRQNILKRTRAVITEVVYADSATILVSAGKNGKLELKATAAMQPAALDLADASLQFAVPFKRDIAEEFIAQGGLVILYRAMAVKDKFFSGTEVVSSTGYRSTDETDVTFSEIDFSFNSIQ